MVSNDVLVINQGTIVQFLPLSDTAREWDRRERTVRGMARGWAQTLVVDHRYAGNLIEGMQGAGLDLDLT
jgi:hypothetical protein